MQFQVIKIAEKNTGQRLDSFLAKKLDISRNLVKRLVQSKDILVNKEQPKKSGIKLHTDDELAYRLPEAKSGKLMAEKIPLTVIFEDKNLLVINKQAGIVIHPDKSGHDSGTIANAVLAHCKNLSKIGGEKRPGIVHRLDKDTSGALLIAKNDKTHEKLSTLFQERKVEKTYLALVKGHLKTKEGRIEAPIKRDSKHRKQMAISGQGKNAITTFHVLEEFELTDKLAASLLEVKIETGRTHQIRVHMASIGHPVIGDSKYGDNRTNQIFRQKYALTRQFLHAKNLKIDGKEFEAELKEDLAQVLKKITP